MPIERQDFSIVSGWPDGIFPVVPENRLPVCFIAMTRTLNFGWVRTSLAVLLCGQMSLAQTAKFANSEPSEKLKAFRSKNAEALKRLRAASRNVEFLEPAWRRLLPPALDWLDETLGYEFKAIEEGVRPDLEYANNLARSLERHENFFAENPGSEIPLRLDRSGDPSLNIGMYAVSLPKDFPNGQKSYPLVIKLHGGEGVRSRMHFNLPQLPRETPFIVAKPKSEGFWSPRSLNYLFSTLKTLLPFDEDRVYLQGGSMGGHGTYCWAMANPGLFAAINPISGSGDVFRASRLRNLPVWIVHGEQDKLVHFYRAELMLTALHACGAKVKYTFHPDAGHNVNQFIDMAEIDQWFLTHKRSQLPVPSDPLDGLKLNQDGIGQKEFITLPSQRFASIQIQSGTRFLPSSHSITLYGFCRKLTGLRAQESVQHQILPSRPKGMINLLLPLPKNIEITEQPEGINLIEAPASRALSFALVWRDEEKHRELMTSTMRELEGLGETPTGEVRNTVLNTSYGIWFGNEMKFIARVDILLK